MNEAVSENWSSRQLDRLAVGLTGTAQKNRAGILIYKAKIMIQPTKKQGQYLAFLHYYMKLNGRPPAESEMERHFKVSPPSVHQMMLTLEKKGFISRIPRQARSIQLLISRGELPDLD
jgi:repressor LexA